MAEAHGDDVIQPAADQPAQEFLRFTVEADVPEFYVETAWWAASSFTITFLMGKSKAFQGLDPKVRINMTPEFAKALSVMLRRAVEFYEQREGRQVGLPPRWAEGMRVTDAEREW